LTLWVPAERLAHIIDTACAKPHPESNTARKLYDLRHGRQQFISYDVAERLLIELGLEWLRHIPKDKGGLADIYEDGQQYGKPNHLSKANLSRPKPWKRSRKPPPFCVDCGKQTAAHKHKRCRPCHLKAVRAPHGTRSCYVGGCRCEPCREAQRAYQRVRDQTIGRRAA